MSDPEEEVSGVCAYSFHPLVLTELERLFADNGIAAEVYRLDARQIRELEGLPVPSAKVYVLEANGRQQATELVAEQILLRNPQARLIVVSESFEEEGAFRLLRAGAKGLLRYEQLTESLVPAVREVAGGGFWVARSLLSRFVDTTLGAGRRLRLIAVSSHLSRREREVHELVLENLSNKEIAARLHMSERTVKFHVSNLLIKHGVKRRADLILLSLTEQRPA
ncbi:MAG: LuxR C-terminal-related transcriptional regulator [Thermoanaerobaculia bacterium]